MHRGQQRGQAPTSLTKEEGRQASWVYVDTARGEGMRAWPAGGLGAAGGASTVFSIDGFVQQKVVQLRTHHAAPSSAQRRQRDATGSGKEPCGPCKCAVTGNRQR